MRTIVVTGAATGIGRATAEAFHAAGHQVILTGRRREPLARAVAELGDPARGVAFDANLLSAVLVTTALRDRLTPGATVVNIGSIAADKGAGGYGAAKAGLASWTVDLAGQLGPHDITVNTLAPGYVADTEFFRDVLDDDRRQMLIASALTRRPSRPDDIADAATFLAGPAARQITGQVIAVNGGEHTSR